MAIFMDVLVSYRVMNVDLREKNRVSGNRDREEGQLGENTFATNDTNERDLTGRNRLAEIRRVCLKFRFSTATRLSKGILFTIRSFVAMGWSRWLFVAKLSTDQGRKPNRLGLASSRGFGCL